MTDCVTNPSDGARSCVVAARARIVHCTKRTRRTWLSNHNRHEREATEAHRSCRCAVAERRAIWTMVLPDGQPQPSVDRMRQRLEYVRAVELADELCLSMRHCFTTTWP